MINIMINTIKKWFKNIFRSKRKTEALSKIFGEEFNNINNLNSKIKIHDQKIGNN